MTRMSHTAKRAIDIVLAIVGLMVVVPFMLPITLAIWISTKHQPLVRQVRAGRHGRPFLLFKLRTMREEYELDGQPLPDSARLTRLGRVVRRLSIDELPQLVNVLLGDMSIVGPRPLPVVYERLYTERERSRLNVRPGMTGWAQINGRQLATFTERLELDAHYVETWSLLFDVKIMFWTIPRLVAGSGVVSGQEPSEVDDRGFSELFSRFLTTDREVSGWRLGRASGAQDAGHDSLRL